jgi:hypothetical protein
MRRRALWITGSLAALAVASTTPESRAAARKRLARWNPLWWAIAIGLWAFILWPR